MQRTLDHCTQMNAIERSIILKIASAFVNIVPELEEQWYNPNNLDPEWAKEGVVIEKNNT